ncbi:MAG: GIY-YIG nuclease family protein [Bacteroidetes bacterium]|nr:GIY-YIG nuclease family protein [Bacteroidota bacterium]
MTQDLQRRVAEHNAGKAKFTSAHRPWKLIYSELLETSTQARKREKYLKSAAGKKFIEKKLRAGSLPD